MGKAKNHYGGRRGWWDAGMVGRGDGGTRG